MVLLLLYVVGYSFGALALPGPYPHTNVQVYAHTHSKNTHTHTHPSHSPERAHAAQCQPSDHGVAVLAVLLHCVDSEQGHLGVGLGIVAEVEVDKLLLDQVLGGYRLNGRRVGVERGMG